MKIKRIEVGFLKTNCYILDNDKNCIIIDPGDEEAKIIKEIGYSKPIGIIITHYHFDHIGALKSIKNKYNIPIYDINNLKEGMNDIDNLSFEVIYTKGHDNTCITIYFDKEKVMFSGDFLFKDDIGRIDLEKSNKRDMLSSIEKIKSYPNDILVYPGHGEETNLGYEKENNYYFHNAF